MLNALWRNGLLYLGERSDEKLRVEPLWEGIFRKEKLAIWRREVKVAPELSRLWSANRRTGFVEGLAAAVAEAKM